MSVQNLYRNYLGRDGDEAGLEFWQGTGLQGSSLRDAFVSSARENNEVILDPNRPSRTSTDLSFLDQPRTRGLGSSFAQTVSSSGPSATAGYTGPQNPVTVQMAGQDANTDVMQIATGYMEQDSPIMQQAETAGRQAANRRGLLNSSLAVGAAQGAVIERILPMAQQTAQQRFQGEMSRQEYQQGQNMSAQEFDQNARLSLQGFRQELASQAERIHAEFDLARIDARTRIAAIEVEGSIRERITGMEISANDRADMIGMLTSYGQQYQEQFRSILSNPDISGEDREDLMRAAGETYMRNVDVANGLFGYEIDWRGGTVARTSTGAETGQMTALPNVSSANRGLGGTGGGTSTGGGTTREQIDPITGRVTVVDESGNPVEQEARYEPRDRPRFNENSDAGREASREWDEQERRRFQEFQYRRATRQDEREEERRAAAGWNGRGG